MSQKDLQKPKMRNEILKVEKASEKKLVSTEKTGMEDGC